MCIKSQVCWDIYFTLLDSSGLAIGVLVGGPPGEMMSPRETHARGRGRAPARARPRPAARPARPPHPTAAARRAQRRSEAASLCL